MQTDLKQFVNSMYSLFRHHCNITLYDSLSAGIYYWCAGDSSWSKLYDECVAYTETTTSVLDDALHAQLEKRCGEVFPK